MITKSYRMLRTGAWRRVNSVAHGQALRRAISLQRLHAQRRELRERAVCSKFCAATNCRQAHRSTDMMANLDISRAPRETKIKLHGADAFEGMRKAGQLAAQALDMLVEHVKPGVTTEHLDDLRARVRHRPWRDPRAAQLPRLSQGHLHVRQSRRLPRHPQHQAPQGRRHRQHRRDADPRRLARRHQPHVRRRPHLAPRRAADRGHLRGADARRGGGEARPHHRPHRRGHPELCRSASAAAWCATSAAMGWAACSTTGPTSCTTASPATAWCSSPACCSPSSR